ncbi:MAG: hypothetical protein QM676_11130 [Novosphingobium sp.]
MKLHANLDFAGAARAVNLLDPASAQDAATKAYVDAQAGGGWAQLGSTVSTTAGSSVAFTAIPATYSDLLLVIEGVSHNSGSAQSLRIETSADGSTWAAAANASNGTAAAAATLYGSIVIPGYRQGAGLLLASLGDLGADNTLSPGAVQVGRHWRHSAGIAALRISLSGGAFDGGTIRLLAR